MRAICVSILIAVVILLPYHLLAGPSLPTPELSPDTVTFLDATAESVLEKCTVPPGDMVEGLKNTLGFRAITPGGYRAIWIQDFTMNYSCGLIPHEDGVRHLKLMLSRQVGAEPRELGGGVIVPSYAIADHINLDGTPVYFPGTYDPDAHMNGEYGFRPPSNNQFDVTWLAYMLAREVDTETFLNQEIEGLFIYERLKRAFEVPDINPETQLVHTTEERRAVGFIFYDTIYMTGDLLMA